MSKELWMEITSAVVYLKNRSPTVALNNMTPYEAWYGHKPDLSHFKPLEITAYVHVPKEKRIKLDSHTRKGILVGYAGTNQYRVWDPAKNDVIVSRDVIFDDEIVHKNLPEVATVEGAEMGDSIEVLPLPRTN